MELRSHPHLLLREHIQEVSAATEALMGWHTLGVATPQIRAVSQLLIKVHDAGKCTAAFQEYISSPETYRGDRREKSHAHLSSLLALMVAQEEKISPSNALALAAAAYGHHTSLPEVESLINLGYGVEGKLLKRQCAMIEPAGIEEETGLPCGAFDLTNRPWAKTKKYLDKQVLPFLEKLPLEEAVATRLRAQLLFSFLLEADKALLAVKDPALYLERPRKNWSPQWIDKKIGSPRKTTVNKLRLDARLALMQSLDGQKDQMIFSLTAPTGAGKTLLAATWALENRQRLAAKTGVAPRIIVVLPFLSIIDQTAQEYEALLRQGAEKPLGEWFLTYHSLADRKYRHDHRDYDPEDSHEAFFIDTWRTELVITTYDQFLMALMAPKARHQMRFHNLCDALIIIDEVQSVPCRLWRPLEGLLKGLTQVGNSRVLLMSATLPAFVDGSVQLLPEYQKFFHAFGRYQIRLHLQEQVTMERFSQEIQQRFPDWMAANKRILITLNTRNNARTIRDTIEPLLLDQSAETTLFFISADVTPRDRLKAIDEIKNGRPCIVVSTQCIEAGVDIDMDLVIRDFAPLDSIIQIAGRCNREGQKPRCLIEIFDLCNENGRRFSEMIYDCIQLSETRRILDGYEKINEEEILEISNQYYFALAQKKNLGEIHLERFARWQEDEPVRTLLRGEEKEQHNFLVIEQDPQLRREIEMAFEMDNHWQRRETLRKLAGRIAKISVSIYAKRGFEPEEIAENWYGLYLLKKNYYDSSRGLTLPTDESGPSNLMIL